MTTRVCFKTFLGLLIFLAAPVARTAEIIFESDIQFKRPEQNSFESLKAGQGIPLKAGDYIFAMTSHNLPLLVVAPEKERSRVVVSNVLLSSSLQLQLKPHLQKATTEIIEGLRQAETLIQKKDLSQATALITSLKNKYQDIPSLIFMSGTLAYLTNDKNTAVQELQRGLELDPGNEPARKLLKQLKGGT